MEDQRFALEWDHPSLPDAATHVSLFDGGKAPLNIVASGHGPGEAPALSDLLATLQERREFSRSDRLRLRGVPGADGAHAGATARMTAWAVALVSSLPTRLHKVQPGVEDARSERVSSYLRSGRYADARRLIDEILRTEARADRRNVLAVFGSSPNMRIRRAPATFACEVGETGVLLPLTVKRKARGLAVRHWRQRPYNQRCRGGEARSRDSRVGWPGSRPRRRQHRVWLAIAERVTIGRTQLGNVPFLVTPADQMPWKELPPGKQGIAGLPLAIALDALRWTRTGTCYTGLAALRNGSAAAPSNLRYVNLHVVTNVEAEGKTLEFPARYRESGGNAVVGAVRKGLRITRERTGGGPGSVRVTQFGGPSGSRRRHHSRDAAEGRRKKYDAGGRQGFSPARSATIDFTASSVWMSSVRPPRSRLTFDR